MYFVVVDIEISTFLTFFNSKHCFFQGQNGQLQGTCITWYILPAVWPVVDDKVPIPTDTEEKREATWRQRQTNAHCTLQPHRFNRRSSEDLFCICW